MSALLSKALPRRALVKAFLAVPAFALFRNVSAPVPLPAAMDDDEIVEVGGWILKRSEVA